jgi:hypothetical protein
LQEVRDYDACARLGEVIAPGIYRVAICSAFREPFQSGLGKQQVAILSKYQAQAAWSEPWKSMNGVDLADAKYQNGFEGLPLSERVTHPGSHGFPDATFDFIFVKGLRASQPTIIRTNASDHWPVTRSFALH